MLKSLNISGMDADVFTCKGLKLHTDGEGLWSRYKKTVRVKSIILDVLEWDLVPNKGKLPNSAQYSYIPHEIRLYFDTKDWDVKKYGLIYTDSLFLKELKQFINKYIEEKFACTTTRKNIAATVSYTEQGMQGDDFVSLEANDPFVLLLIKEALWNFSCRDNKKHLI